MKKLLILVIAIALLALAFSCGRVFFDYWRFIEHEHKLSDEVKHASIATAHMGDCGAAYVEVYTTTGNYNRLEFYFRDRDIDDEKLRNLEGLTVIVGLDLSGTKITDAGLASIKGLTNLEYLQLANTAVTDRGLGELIALPKLQALDLVNTKVTQEGAKYLEQLSKLKAVYAKGTRLTTVRGVRVDISVDSKQWPWKRGTYHVDPLDTVRRFRPDGSKEPEE
ncbi:MAG: leucine-rich repeat domain-containing protein [Planctomycetota bacterium]